MVDWNPLVGTTIRGRGGNLFKLGSLSSVSPQSACFLDASGKNSFRIWHPDDSTTTSELTRRIRELGACDRARFGLPPIEELELQSGWFGHATETPSTTATLSDLIRWDGSQSWLTWYARRPLRARLRIASALSAIVSRWSTTGYARCEWPLDSLLVLDDDSVLGNDPENFSRSNRTRTIPVRDSFALAPELLDGSRQPDTLSDAFSLAVIIYALLKTFHPFGGPGSQADNRSNWVDDPNGSSSGDLITSTLIFTDRQRSLFFRAFVEGRRFRLQRPTPAEWVNACQDALDRTTSCGACGADCLIPSASPRRIECPFCGEQIADVFALEFFDVAVDSSSHPSRTKRRRSNQMLQISGAEGTNLYWRHCRFGEPDEATILARIHQNADQLMIRNTSVVPMFVFAPGSARSTAIPSGGESAFPVNSQILFDRPQSNRAARGARLVKCGGAQ